MRRLGLIAALLAVPGLAAADGGQQGKSTKQMGKQEAVQQFRAEDGLFSAPNYDLEGRISKVEKNRITISRDQLPAAELSIAGNSKITLDGNAASTQQLRPGQQVSAKFNLQGDRPVAVEVSAERREGMAQRQPTETPQQAMPAQQQPPQEERSAAAGGTQAAKSVVGKVEGVEQDKLSLRNELGETHEFSLGDDTRYTRDGQTVSKDEIEQGDEVRAAFRGEPGNLQATEIILMSPAREQKSQQQQPRSQQ